MKKKIELEDFNKTYRDLAKEDKKELFELREKLLVIEKESKDPNVPITDKELKKKIAKICLKLINQTSRDKIAIMETSYIITGHFIWNVYGDELDDAVSLAGQLELPEKHVQGDVLELWDKLKRMFEDYLK